MNKEELYKLALSDVSKYKLLNELFAIRDKRVETVDYTMALNGFISLDVLNDYVNLQQERNNYKELYEKEISKKDKLKSLLIKKMNEYVTYQGDLSSIYEEVFDEMEDLERL